MRVALLVVAGMLEGCTLTAPVPGGPLRPDTFTAVQATWAYAYGPAQGSQTGAQPVSGNGQTVGRSGELGAAIPITLGVRQALRSWLEASGDIGWLSSGVELRAGTPGGVGRWPFAFSSGLRSPMLAIGVPENNSKLTYETRARLELYPELWTKGFDTTRLLLSVGVAWGVFEHSIEGQQIAGGDVPDFDARFVVVRPETRLELAIGINLRTPRGSLTFAIAPWILLDAQAPLDRCGGACPPSAFSQTWGVSFLFSPSIGGDLIARLARNPA